MTLLTLLTLVGAHTTYTCELNAPWWVAKMMNGLILIISIKIRNFRVLVFLKNLSFKGTFKVIYTKYSKHWPYAVAHTINCVCIKMLNHGLNHGFFLLLFKLKSCPIHWIVCVLAYLNFISEFTKMSGSAQTHKIMSFIWIV